MAEPNLTSGERLSVYKSLFLINECYDSIVQRLRELDNAKTFTPEKLEELCGFTQEVQLLVNNRLIEDLHTTERADWYAFGKFRAAREDQGKK